MNFSRNVNSTVDNQTVYNVTNTFDLPGVVALLSYLTTLAVILSIVFNVLVVLTFIRKPSLITPFTIQFLNFVLIQLANMLYNGPLNVLPSLDSTLFLKPVFCAFYKFGAWTFLSIALLQQMAIGLDRWSALLYPVWRRTKTVKYGVQVTLSLIAVYLALYVPLFVKDTVTGVPAGARCDYHHVWKGYQIVVRTATFYLPLFFTYISYPLLALILRRRRNLKVKNAETAQLQANEFYRRNGTKKTELSGNQPAIRNRSQFTDSEVASGPPTAKGSLDSSHSVEAAPIAKSIGNPGPRASRSAGNGRKLQLSMWMMLVQIVCSMPLTVTYTMIQYGPENRYPYLNDVNVFSIFLTAVNIVIDPIMYWIFFKDLRAETYRLLRCR